MLAPLKALLVAVAGALSLAIALAAWRIVDSQQEREAQARLEFRVREIAQELSGRMHDYEQVLRGTHGLLAASQHVTAGEWRTYVATLQLDARYPGIQAIGYAPYLLKGGRAMAQIRFVEPRARGNERSLAFDMMSEADLRRGVERARDTGEGVLTGRVTLISEQAGSSTPGFVLVLPVYRGVGVPASLEARRERFAAVVYASFRAEDLFRGTIGQPSGLHLRLFDVTDSPPAVLYEDERDEGRPRYGQAHTIVVRGRTWRLEAKSRPALEALIAGDRARLVLTAGIALSVLFTALVWSLVTTRERAGELARGIVAAGEERDRFRSAVDSHWDTMLMVDADRMRIVYANEGACRNLGYRREELIGQSPAIVFSDRDERVLVEEYRQMRQSGKATEIDRGAFRRKDGSTFPVEVSRQLLQTGGATYVLGVARDITARLEAERSLRDSEGRLALALESSGLALFDWDLQSNLVHLGAEWQAMLGGEAVGTVTPIQKLEQLVHPDDLPALSGQLRKLLAGESDSYRVEHRVRMLDGQWKWIESVAKVSGRDASGRAVRVTGTNADISDRKAVAELKNAFIASVSHELRTPLTGIVTSLDLLQEGSAGELPEDARKFVEIAYGNSERLQALIDDILDLERVETGRLRLELGPISVGQLLTKSAALNAPYAERFGARIATAAVPAELRVRADEARLLQILANLISNAAKHSPVDGEIRLAAQRKGDRVVLSVADRGEGIPEEFKSRIFGKFEQADGGRAGTGLGLAISKALVERMGGEIRFDSEPRRGTIFYVELSLAN
jgi:PAS domain S-box-containing protein